MRRGFISGFASDLEAMIDLKTSLGYSENTYLSRARDLDRFCADHYPDAAVLTEGLVIDWMRPNVDEQLMAIHGKAAFARCLATFQKAMGRDSYMLPDRFTAGKSIFVPYLFGDDELRNLFKSIDSYKYNKEPLRPIMFSTYFRLTYTCGLRPREGRELKRNAIDIKSGEIRIVDSKNHKGRTVIMSDEMLSLMRRYCAMRDAVFQENPFLFPNPKGGPYTAAWMNTKFKNFFIASKPDVPKDLLPSVRVYDLRHRFATAVLNRWLDEKKDLNSRLIYLQTYMGHTELNSTAYYIHLLPENLVKSAGIDWDSMNSLLPRVELWEK